MKMYSCWLIWLFIGFVVGVNHAIQDQMNVSTVVTEPYIHSSGTNSKASSSSCLKGFKANELNVFLVFARIVTPVVFGLILIIGFVGNLFVMIVVLANAQMRNTTNILIFSLAVADMAFIVICVPSAAIVYVAGKWPLGLSLCRIYYYSSYVSVYCSVYTLVLMSLDRFVAVVYPIQCMHIRTQKNTTIAVFITWTVVLVTNIPLFIGAILVKGPPEGGESSCVTEYCTYS
ncbi:Galanin receptor type 2, variant 2 [Schistosoma haematobium]|nr:Galanin receptor type 2, variant 2 [Schistosoma haematobium]KAH9590807.1 Galanin receptor type 2, variant 2 [Schistosoma haematobium]